jgi:coenzyme F420-reducing hydrogenase beta subunit
MVPNDLDVIVPKVDISTCTDCGLCQKICPQNIETKLIEPKVVYAAWAKNKEEHLSSSSGGAASIFYRNFIAKYSGICVGAAFGDGLVLRHQMAENLEDLLKFKGSKYVQSFIGNIFSQIKESLKNKKPVLFIGTPCQVDGLKFFLGNIDTEFLYTVDLICHGVPPNAYLQQHFKNYLKRDSKMIVSFRANNHFRMTLSSYNGEKTTKKSDIYLYAFLKGLIYRESCYNCRYAQKKRSGDITIGDFWGLADEIASIEDANNGCSAIIINTEKGNTLFEMCKNDFILFERTFEEASKENEQLNYPSVPHEKRNLFLKRYKKGFSFACTIALFPDFQINSIYEQLRSFVPKRIKSDIKRILGLVKK